MIELLKEDFWLNDIKNMMTVDQYQESMQKFYNLNHGIEPQEFL